MVSRYYCRHILTLDNDNAEEYTNENRPHKKKEPKQNYALEWIMVKLLWWWM